MIFLDLETQSLIADAKYAACGVRFDERKKKTQGLWSRLRRTVWKTNPAHPFSITPNLQDIFRDRGRPSFAPYMAMMRDPGPITSVRDLYSAIQNGKIGEYDIGYNPLHHELFIEPSYIGKLGSPHIVNRLLGMSVAVTWDCVSGFQYWREHQVEALVQELLRHSVVVGANLMGFDYPVLERYVPDVRARLGFRTIDILNQTRWGIFLSWLTNELGRRPSKTSIISLLRAHEVFPVGDLDYPYRFKDASEASPFSLRDDVWDVAAADTIALRKLRPRVTLDNLAKGTLGLNKSRKAASATELYHSKRYRELIAYCEHDVALTRDIFFCGVKNGNVTVSDVNAPVRWGFLAKRLARVRRSAGPTTERECAMYQHSLVAKAPLLLPAERWFRGVVRKTVPERN